MVSDESDYVYIGSTITELRMRFYDHKKASKKYSLRKVYDMMNQVGFEKCRIILVESFPCTNRVELTAREEHWRIIYKEYALNTHRCHLTQYEKEAQYKRCQQTFLALL